MIKNQGAIRLALLCLLGLIAVAGLVGAEPKNLALAARATVSPGAVGHGEFDENPPDACRFANDANLDTSLGFPSDHSPAAWIGLSWRGPFGPAMPPIGIR